MPEVYPTTGPTPERTWRRHHYGLFLWPPLRLWEFPKATIAQVHGYCVGGGTVYGLLTDLTICSDDAYFQMPLPQGFGLPGAQTMIEPWVLMNFKRAAEYLFLAPTIGATQAKEWGMVNRVVPRANLDVDGGGHRRAPSPRCRSPPSSPPSRGSPGRGRAWACACTCSSRPTSWPSAPAPVTCAANGVAGRSRPRQKAADQKTDG